MITGFLVASGALAISAGASALSWPQPLREAMKARKAKDAKENVFLDPIVVFRAVHMFSGVLLFALGCVSCAFVLLFVIPDRGVITLVMNTIVGGLAINQAWLTWAAALVSRSFVRFNIMIIAWGLWIIFAIWWQQ